jgi:hypothetical protein
MPFAAFVATSACRSSSPGSSRRQMQFRTHHARYVQCIISVFPTFVAARGVVQIRFWIHEPMIFVAGAIFIIAL